MSEQRYGADQGMVPLPPAPSQNPTLLPPPSLQNVAVPAVAVPRASVIFTLIPEKSRRRIKCIAVGAVALIVLGVIVTVTLAIANWARTPRAQVRQYLDLLVDGKAGAVTAMVDPELPNDQCGFLSDEAMALSSARIEVEDVTVDGAKHPKERVVTVTMRLDGKRFTRSSHVSEAKKTFGLPKNWKIQDAMVSRVDVRVDNITHFSIGGEKTSVATLKEAPSSSTVPYPGAYTSTPEETGEYIDAVSKTIPAKATTGYDSFHYGGTVELKGTYNDKMAAVALEVAAALTNLCTTVLGNVDTACPNAVQSRTLALLQIKTMLMAMKATTDEGGVYTSEVAFTIRGMESQEKQHDVTSRVTATVKTDKDGKLELDASDEPQFEVRFAYQGLESRHRYTGYTDLTKEVHIPDDV